MLYNEKEFNTNTLVILILFFVRYLCYVHDRTVGSKISLKQVKACRCIVCIDSRSNVRDTPPKTVKERITQCDVSIARAV